MNEIITIDGIEYINGGSTIPAGSAFDALRDAYCEFGIEDRINITQVGGRGYLQAYVLVDGTHKLADMSTDGQVAKIANRRSEEI